LPFLASIELTTECVLRCPFCYAMRRYRHLPRPTRWSLDDLLTLLREFSEVFSGDGEWVTAFGGGEPALTPKLLGAALRASLDLGARYTSFTTSGCCLGEGTLRVIEDAFGGPLRLPEAFLTVSLDTYKLLKSPRAAPGRVDGELIKAWRAVRPYLRLAASRWGHAVPKDPPKVLEVVSAAWLRGWDVAVNILVTDDIIPLLTPLGEGTALLKELGVRAEQVQFLTPKPLKGLLNVVQGYGPTYSGRRVRVLKYVANLWASKLEGRLAVDQAMATILGFKPPGAEEGSFCVAGKLLVSIDPYGRVAPCSFAPHVTRWKPGGLRRILNSMHYAAPPLEGGCPYL